MGCTLRGGGCCGVVLASAGLNPSIIVGWRWKSGYLIDPFKGGADWLVGKFTGGRLETGTEESGDVLIGGRIGRVGVLDVEAVGEDDDDDEPKIFVAGLFSA
jgi:hypothetical protein